MDLSDPTAFGRAYDEHHRGVHAAALRILGNAAQAQDVTQDVFLKLWRDPQKFDAAAASSAPTCASWPAAGPWISGARARPRAARATASRSSSPTRSRASRSARPRWSSARASGAPCARRSARCPAPQREAVVLAYWGGLTADQIARRAGVPLGTAKSRIRLGLAKLRSEIEDDGRAGRHRRLGAAGARGHRLGSRAACR